MGELRAFICSVRGLSEGGVYMATEASKARAQAYRASRELGYHVGFPDIEVRRAPRFDGIPHPGYGGFTMDFAEHLLRPRSEEATDEG
jgi:hypothetical protein